MSLRKPGSYRATVEKGVDLLPLIIKDASERLGVNLDDTHLHHVSIFGKDGDIFTINSFDYALKNQTLAIPILGRDHIRIKSIVPQQSGDVEILYIR